MKRSFAGAALATGLVAIAGAQGSGASQAPRASLQSRTTVYFLTDGGRAPLGVRRSVRRSHGSYARGALEALLAGPTKAEARAGLTSAIPRGVRIISFRFKQGPQTSDVKVDLSGLPPAQTTGAVPKVRVITQVARTLIGHEDIGRVWIRGNGKPWGLWDLHGHVIDVPHTYGELLGFYQICASAPGTETVPGDCFSALP